VTHQDTLTNCCRDGILVKRYKSGPVYTDRICPDHADLGAETRARAWVRSALHQVENGKPIGEVREFWLKEPTS